MGSITPSNYKYEKEVESGLYRLMGDGTVLSASQKVAVACAITKDGHVIRHRFGPPDLVRHWFEDSSAKYRAFGLGDIADELCIIESDRWDVEDLNKIVHIEGYLGVFLKRIGLDPIDLLDRSKIHELTPG